MRSSTLRPLVSPRSSTRLTRGCPRLTSSRSRVGWRWHRELPLYALTRGVRVRGLDAAGQPSWTRGAAERAPTLVSSAPAAMQLSTIVPHVADLGLYQHEPVVWEAPDLIEAWRRLYRCLGDVVESDPLRAERLKTRDLVGLARCTAHAEVLHLLSLLPPGLRAALVPHPNFRPAGVEEFFVHLGQEVEVRGGSWVVPLPAPSAEDLQHILRRVGRFGEDGRGCVAFTAHRVSLWRSRRGEPLGVTVRVGRFVPNAARALVSLARRGSVLIISKAGMGKTTLLRDLAASLAHQPERPRVNVVDTSNEIGGDGPAPLPFLGRCRRTQVPRREAHCQVMTEVIQNHSPEYLIVDEISTTAEAEAAWSIGQRGVHLIASCHGESLAGLVQNQSLNLLVGGAAQAFLSNEERRLRHKTKKTILERPHSSPFHFVVELVERGAAFVYVRVNEAVDLILDDQEVHHNAAVGGEVVLSEPLPLRLERMIALDAKKRLSTAQRRVEDRSRSASAAVGSARDADGYITHDNKYEDGTANSDAEQSRSHAPRRDRKKTDEQLLSELSDSF